MCAYAIVYFGVCLWFKVSTVYVCVWYFKDHVSMCACMLWNTIVHKLSFRQSSFLVYVLPGTLTKTAVSIFEENVRRIWYRKPNSTILQSLRIIDNHFLLYLKYSIKLFLLLMLWLIFPYQVPIAVKNSNKNLKILYFILSF